MEHLGWCFFWLDGIICWDGKRVTSRLAAKPAGVGLHSQLGRQRSHGDADGTTGGKGGSWYILDDTNGQGPQVIRVRTSRGLKLKWIVLVVCFYFFQIEFGEDVQVTSCACQFIVSAFS